MKVFKIKTEKMKVKGLSLGVQLVLLASLFVLYSCDENTTVNVPIDPVVIELDDIPVVEESSALKSGDDLNSFYVTKDFNISDWESHAETAAKYQSMIESVKVGTVGITITATDSEGTMVKDLLLQMNDDCSLYVDQYDLGTSYTDDLQDFGKQFLLNLFSNGNINLTISGKTDVVAGENLTVKITMDNITLITKPLK